MTFFVHTTRSILVSFSSVIASGWMPTGRGISSVTSSGVFASTSCSSCSVHIYTWHFILATIPWMSLEHLLHFARQHILPICTTFSKYFYTEYSWCGMVTQPVNHNLQLQWPSVTCLTQHTKVQAIHQANIELSTTVKPCGPSNNNMSYCWVLLRIIIINLHK